MKNQSSAKIDQTSTASTAENECQQVGTVEKSTAAIVVKHSHTKNAKRPYKKKVDVTHRQTSTGTCQHCGDDMIVIRTTGAKRKKYCGTRCRVAAHRAAHR